MEDLTFTLSRAQALALLEASDGPAYGPVIAARQRLRESLGTEDVRAAADRNRYRPDPHRALVGQIQSEMEW